MAIFSIQTLNWERNCNRDRMELQIPKGYYLVCCKMLVHLRGINSNFINQFPEGSFSMAITRRKVHLFRIILLISLTLVSLLERSVTGDQTLDSALVLHCSADPIGSAVWQQSKWVLEAGQEPVRSLMPATWCTVDCHFDLCFVSWKQKNMNLWHCHEHQRLLAGDCHCCHSPCLG